MNEASEKRVEFKTRPFFYGWRGGRLLVEYPFGWMPTTQSRKTGERA